MTNRLSYLEAKIVSNSVGEACAVARGGGARSFEEAISPAAKVLGQFGFSDNDITLALMEINSTLDPMMYIEQGEVRDRLNVFGVVFGSDGVDIPVLRDYPLWAKEIAETRESVLKDTQTVEQSAGKSPADIYADAKDSLERNRANLQVLLDGTNLSEENLATMEEVANSTNSTLEISLVWLLEDIQRRKK